MSDFWAYCDPCGRWFYPDADGDAGRVPTCPVCSTEASTLSEHPDEMPEASASA